MRFLRSYATGATGGLLWLPLMVVSGLSVPVRAQVPAKAILVELNPAATAVHWTLTTTVHTVHGTFRLKKGSIRVDPASGEASGLLVFDATSGESGEAARDKTMHRDVLQSARYPEITFRPTRVEGKVDLSAAGPVTVKGILNLHGQDHPMELPVDLHPQGSGVALSTHFTIPFVAWGLKDPSTFIFRTAKEVSVVVESVATPR